MKMYAYYTLYVYHSVIPVYVYKPMVLKGGERQRTDGESAI